MASLELPVLADRHADQPCGAAHPEPLALAIALHHPREGSQRPHETKLTDGRRLTDTDPDMKRWAVILVVVISLSAMAFTAMWARTHQDQDHIATPAEMQSYEASVCYAAEHDLPHPAPLYVGNGKWMGMSCDLSSR